MGDEIILYEESSGGSGAFLNGWSLDLSFLQDFIARVGENPLAGMWWLFLHGGWIVFAILALFGFRALWLEWRQGITASKKTFILLAVDVPRMSEQTVKAVENMFAHLAGAHGSVSFLEKWFEGKYQDALSVEIISINGHVQYLIRCITAFRDFIEASIYAQYPDAEITQVEDYTAMAPSNYPDDVYDVYGVELTPVKSEVYPLKTYIDFEHSLTGEFKDPLAVLLEAFSRLGPGEQAWYQIVLIPIEQKAFADKALKEIMKLKGDKPVAKKTMVDKALDLPLNILSTAGDVLLGSGGGEVKKSDEKQMRMLMLSPGERNRLEAIERKMSKIQFKCKIRFVYIAKHEVFTKSKILQSFIGSIKQFNTNDMQALKPDMKRTATGGSMIFFKKMRSNARKERIIRGYRGRSGVVGLESFCLGTDELASLWHLPVVLNVKAPQLKKTEAKKVEPPMHIPFG